MKPLLLRLKYWALDVLGWFRRLLRLTPKQLEEGDEVWGFDWERCLKAAEGAPPPGSYTFEIRDVRSHTGAASYGITIFCCALGAEESVQHWQYLSMSLSRLPFTKRFIEAIGRADVLVMPSSPQDLLGTRFKARLTHYEAQGKIWSKLDELEPGEK